MRRSFVALAGVPLCFSATRAHAQEFTGRVSDATNAAIPKASITVRNEGTNVVLRTKTTGSGDYTIPYLKPGLYSITAEMPGFESQVKEHINLETGKTGQINFSLRVGTQTEVVNVTDSALLDASKADRGEVTENERVTELPLNGRDPNMLSVLSAGVVWTGYIGYQRPFDDTMQNLSINGGDPGQNEMLLDGVTNESASANNNGNSNIAYVPPVDSVQEFKIVTNPYDAQYGRAGGGVMDVTLKSGTNAIHGDVYEFARRTFLDANTWQNNYLAATNDDPVSFTRPQHKLDQYGFELDGPVVLPKLYNGRNKTFFLTQYENWNEVVPNSIVNSVPDPSWLTGDFSNLTYWTGSSYAPITIYDPLSLHQDASGAYVRNPFPNNKIPSSRINPVAAKILSYFPKPNTTVATGNNLFSNNYSAPNPTTDRYRNVIGKLDQNFGSADRFSLRYGYWERVEIRGYNGLPGPIANGQLPHGERSHTFVTQWTHTFSPRLIFDFRGNVIVRADYSYGGPKGFDPTTLGLPASMVSQFGSTGSQSFPDFDISEFASIGNNTSSQTVSNSMNLFPSITWSHGRHTVHAGADMRFQQVSNDVVGGGPYFWVDRQWTQADYTAWDQASGNSIASLLLGTPTSGNVSLNETSFWSQHYFAPFVQDDWKITPRLTLNLGVRWDFNPSAKERNNRALYAFNPTAASPISGMVSSPYFSGPLTGAYSFLGQNGNPRTLYPLTLTDIQPRVGFAFAATPVTVVRGGFGEMIRNPQPGADNLGYSQTTNFNATLDGGRTPNATLSDPFPVIVQPQGAALGAYVGLGQGPYDINPNYHPSRFYTFSFGIEQKFTNRDTLEMAYSGSQLFGGDTSDNINIRPLSYLQGCNLDLGGDPVACNNDYVANPFQGIAAFQTTSLGYASTVQHAQLLRPHPQYNGFYRYQLNDGRSSYNSLQVTAVHKWTDALTMHGTWTWSKKLNWGGFNDVNFRVPYRALDGNDRPHRVTLSAVYDLPIGRGRTFGGKMNRLLDGAVGGWELGSLFIYETGWPWGVPGNPSTNYTSNAYVKRSIDPATGYIRGVAACAQEWTLDSSTNRYSLQPLSFGNYTGPCTQSHFTADPTSWSMSRNTVYTGIRVPSNYQFDTNLSKNFQVVDRVKLQLRLEAFNVLNHPLWQEAYAGSLYDPNFGTIERGNVGQSNLPRQVQIAAKLIW